MKFTGNKAGIVPLNPVLDIPIIKDTQNDRERMNEMVRHSNQTLKDMLSVAVNSN